MKIVVNENIEFLKREDAKRVFFNKKTKQMYVIGEQEYKVLDCIKNLNKNEGLTSKCDFLDKGVLDKLLKKFYDIGLIKGRKETTANTIYKIRLRLLNGDNIVNPKNLIWKLFYVMIKYLSIPIFVIGILSAFYKKNNILNIIVSEINLSQNKLIYYIIILLLSLFLHEISHSVVAIFNNVNVPEIGLMLYWGIPCAYANLSCIKLQEDKKKRLEIYFSGIKMNFLLAGIGLLFLSLFKIKSFFLIEIFTFLVLMNLSFIFLNMQFFLKMDGYFIIQELLGVSNLKEKSLDEAKKLLSVFKRNPNYKVQVIEKNDNLFLEKMIIKLYSYGSFVYIPSILFLLITLIIRFVLMIWR